MSAYITTDGVVNRIVNFLWSDDGGPYKYCSYSLRKIGYDAFGNPEQLGRHMHQLNRVATGSRYHRSDPYTYKYKFAWPGDRYQILKDFQCFLYQCSEEVAVDTKLFKALQAAEKALMQELINERPEAKATVWNKE